MRTTIDLKNHLLKRAKAKAQEKGVSLSELVSNAVAAYLTGPSEWKTDPPFELITAGSPNETAPSWNEMKRILEEEDRAKFGGN